MADGIDWLLASDEPWTRYRTLVDLLDRDPSNAEVLDARREMLDHPQVQSLVAQVGTWGERPCRRHNDASYPTYALSTLADFGLRITDPGVQDAVDPVLAHQSPEGAFQTVINVPTHFGGTGEDHWTWIACDAPTLLYALLSMGLEDDPRVQRAVAHLAELGTEDGWHCVASPDMGTFKGPGKRSDPCPIANVYALKALSFSCEWIDSPVTRAGTEMLLWHWAHQGERKLFLFGIGTDFRKLKYPFVWYDILHVVDVLSRFPFVRQDPRFREMVEELVSQGDEDGRYTARSMYRAWQGWSFADKKRPSPWLTYLVARIKRRMEGGWA